VYACDHANCSSRVAHRFCPGICARYRRIRFRRIYFGKSAPADRDHAASHHHQTRTIRLRWRHGYRGGHACGLIHTAARDQSASGSKSALSGALMTRIVQWLLVGVALLFLSLFLVTPLVAVFAEALDKGLGLYWESIK